MRNVKSILGGLGALAGVLYCCGLIYYFIDTTGSAREAVRDGLGPTLLGLGAVGLLFCVPLIVKFVRVVGLPRPPGGSGGGDPDAPTHDATHGGGGGIDADAIIARHLARRSLEGSPTSPTTPPARQSGRPAKSSGFGRRVE